MVGNDAAVHPLSFQDFSPRINVDVASSDALWVSMVKIFYYLIVENEIASSEIVRSIFISYIWINQSN